MGVVRPDALGNDHAAPHAIEKPGVKHNLTALVAEFHPRTFGDAKGFRIERMQHHFWPPLALARAGRLREGRVEKAARRRCCKSERMLRVGFLDETHMVRIDRKSTR